MWSIVKTVTTCQHSPIESIFGITLEKIYYEEKLIGSSINQMLQHRAKDRFIRILLDLSGGNMDKDGFPFDLQ